MAVSITLAAVLLFAGVCYASQPGRIVGGELTNVEHYPSIVQSEHLSWLGSWSQSCAGNILTSTWFLSAAHCFAAGTLPANRRIRAGATFRHTGGQVIEVAQYYNHPNYLSDASRGNDADITVVRLVSPLVYNPVVQQGTIIAHGSELPDGIPVIHAGWGTTQWQGSASPQLRDVTIYTINYELCRRRYAERNPPAIVTENMICAGILDVGGKDACQGDSGGPLYYKSNDIDIIVGVVSWGHQCANRTYPGISTAVSPYTNWIMQTVS